MNVTKLLSLAPLAVDELYTKLEFASLLIPAFSIMLLPSLTMLALPDAYAVP